MKKVRVVPFSHAGACCFWFLTKSVVLSLKHFLILGGLIGYMLLFSCFSFYHCYSFMHPLMIQGLSHIFRICSFKPLQHFKTSWMTFLGTINVHGLLRQRTNWSRRETRLKKFFCISIKKEEILYLRWVSCRTAVAENILRVRDDLWNPI